MHIIATYGSLYLMWPYTNCDNWNEGFCCVIHYLLVFLMIADLMWLYGKWKDTFKICVSVFCLKSTVLCYV